MLVLTRKQQETIHIGDDVTITIVRIKGNAVRVGIEAPEAVRVLRGEVAQREAREPGGEPAVASDEPSATIAVAGIDTLAFQPLAKCPPLSRLTRRPSRCAVAAVAHAV